MKTIKRKLQDRRGFTMMEIMVVIFILALFLGMASTRLRTGTQSDLNNTIQEFAMLGRQLRSKARVHDRTYRIVFEFPIPNSREERQEYPYWVEYSTSRVFLPDPEEAAEPWTYAQEETTAAQQQGFQMDSARGEEKRTLPHGLRLAQVEVADGTAPIQEGQAMIHFFPNGRVEESTVHFSWGPEGEDVTRKWTLYFRPFTGDPEVLADHVPLENLKVSP